VSSEALALVVDEAGLPVPSDSTGGAAIRRLTGFGFSLLACACSSASGGAFLTFGLLATAAFASLAATAPVSEGWRSLAGGCGTDDEGLGLPGPGFILMPAFARSGVDGPLTAPSPFAGGLLFTAPGFFWILSPPMSMSATPIYIHKPQWEHVGSSNATKREVYT
jgi:hypothetical protein